MSFIGSATQTRVILFCLLLAAAVVSLYANTLFHDFVFDDVTLIQQNTDVTELNWGRILGRTGYRPVRTFTYALNFALGGANPFGYHLLNLILHAVNSILTFLLLRSILGRLDASFLGAMFFAVHPVQTASVAYVSGRKDLLAAFFLLLASLLYIQWRRRRGWPRGVFTGLAVFLAVLSKEVAVVFPVLFVLIDLCGSRKSFRAGDGKGVTAALKKSARLYTLLATVAIAAVYYAVVWTEASRMAGYWGGSLAAQWATSFKLFVHYLSLALMPYPLLADYTGVFPISTGLTEAATLVCVLISAAYLGLAVWLLRRRPLVTLGMGWFLVPLLPVLQIVGFHEIAADHFLYLPMVGAALVFGNLGAEAAASPKANVLAKAFLLAIFVLGSILTVSRNLDDPGYCYVATGRVSAAIPHLRRSVAIRPYSAGLRLLAYALVGVVGEADEAVALYQQALQRNPESFATHYLLGVAFLGLGRKDLAGQHLLRAHELVDRQPRSRSTKAYRQGIRRELEKLNSPQDSTPR